MSNVYDTGVNQVVGRLLCSRIDYNGLLLCPFVLKMIVMRMMMIVMMILSSCKDN